MIRNGDNRWSATTENIGLPGLDLTNDDLQNIMFRYLNELKECGVKGLRFDASKHIGLPKDGVNFFKRVKMFLLLNGMYGYGEFLGGTKEWRDEMAKYIDVLTPADSEMTNNNKKVAFFESHDTYLNFDQHFHTRNLTEQDYIYIYKKLRNMFKNTLVYVSPIDENGPFGKNIDNLTCEEVLKLNEQDYFKRVYLENERIKEVLSGYIQKPSRRTETKTTDQPCHCTVCGRLFGDASLGRLSSGVRTFRLASGNRRLLHREYDHPGNTEKVPVPQNDFDYSLCDRRHRPLAMEFNNCICNCKRRK